MSNNQLILQDKKLFQLAYKKHNSKEYTKRNDCKNMRAMIFVSTLRSGEGLADFACSREKNILAKETPTFDVGLCIN